MNNLDGVIFGAILYIGGQTGSIFWKRPARIFSTHNHLPSANLPFETHSLRGHIFGQVQLIDLYVAIRFFSLCGKDFENYLSLC